MKRFIKGFIGVTSLIVVTMPAYSQSLTLEQVLQRVIDHYPSIKTASIQVEKAKQESIKIDSQLAWQLGAQAGISRNVSLFGIASDKLDASGSLSHQLKSGSTLSIDASLAYEDSETSFSPTIPNPATVTSVNLSYREPLSQGASNPSFNEAKTSAKAGVIIAKAEKEKLYDQLANSVIDIYLSAAITQSRISNISKAVNRTQRLQKFIKNREKLGIAEEKDTLQVDAQLLSQKAELSALNIVWHKQRIALNRLMGSSVDAQLNPEIVTDNQDNQVFETVYKSASTHSPELKTVNGRILLADSAIRLQRDADKDNLDLILYVGATNQSGDLAVGNSNESDIVGGARLEFAQNQDKSGLDAQLYQAQLERSAAIEDKRQIIEDLHYDLSSLLVEIKASKDSLTVYKQSVDSERRKLKEAESRYKTGRADTDQLIQFESQLSIAELSLELQQIELVRRNLTLRLKQGGLWNSVHKPELDNFLLEDES